MKKRGQVTIFIIIGLIVLLLAAISIHMTGIFYDLDNEDFDVEGFENVKLFVESCLEQQTKEGLIIIGEQGGYIGSVDIIPEPFSAEINGVKTCVGIRNIPENRYSTWFEGDYQYASTVPQFPWPSFAIDSQHFSSTHKLGQSILPPLEEGYGGTTIKDELETFIENSIKSCDVKNSFQEQVDVSASKNPNAEVRFTEGNVDVSLDYPINITRQGKKIKFEDYRVRLPINMEKFYSFIKELAFYEVSDIKFDIEDVSHYSQLSSYDTGYSVRLSKNTAEVGVDTIVVYYENTGIFGNYTFRFLRQDRIPAIYGLEAKPSYDLSNINLGTFCSHNDRVLNYIKPPKGVDADEGDNLVFTYKKSGSCPYLSVVENSGEIIINCPTHYTNSRVYDDCYVDVFVSDETDNTPKDYDTVKFSYACSNCCPSPSCGVCSDCCTGCCMRTECCDADGDSYQVCDNDCDGSCPEY